MKVFLVANAKVDVDEDHKVRSLYWGGKVYTKIIVDASSATLIPIIEQMVIPDSIVYTDGWKSYNILEILEFWHFRINHSLLFADRHNHFSGIENFWNQGK